MTAFEYDSADWRALRNSLLHLWINDVHAVSFLLTIGNVAEVWDDLIDGDKEVTPDAINRTFMSVLTQLPLNPFFDKYKFQLVPLMVTGINTWQDSDLLAKGNETDKAMAYVLRDWYVELVLEFHRQISHLGASLLSYPTTSERRVQVSAPSLFSTFMTLPLVEQVFLL